MQTVFIATSEAQLVINLVYVAISKKCKDLSKAAGFPSVNGTYNSNRDSRNEGGLLPKHTLTNIEKSFAI